jgi:hypothetical protein
MLAAGTGALREGRRAAGVNGGGAAVASAMRRRRHDVLETRLG